MKPILPAFGYEGGKAALRSWLINYIPAGGSLYIEPFAGRGNMFWLVCCCRQFKDWWLNDLRQAPFFEALKVVDVKDLPVSVERLQGDDFLAGKLRGDPIPWIMESAVVWSGSRLETNWFKGTRRTGRNGLITEDYNHIAWCKKVSNAQAMLRHYKVRITDWDYTALPWHDWDESVLAYVDPPYQGIAVRSYSEADLDYGELVQLLKQTKARWVLSEYEHPMYLKAFGRPVSRKFKGSSCSLNRGTKRSGRVECVWQSKNLRGKV